MSFHVLTRACWVPLASRARPLTWQPEEGLPQLGGMPSLKALQAGEGSLNMCLMKVDVAQAGRDSAVNLFENSARPQLLLFHPLCNKPACSMTCVGRDLLRCAISVLILLLLQYQ